MDELVVRMGVVHHNLNWLLSIDIIGNRAFLHPIKRALNRKMFRNCSAFFRFETSQGVKKRLLNFVRPMFSDAAYGIAVFTVLFGNIPEDIGHTLDMCRCVTNSRIHVFVKALDRFDIVFVRFHYSLLSFCIRAKTSFAPKR